VLFVVAMESMGIPVPGETILVTAALYAATTHRLDISRIILAASVGAILGDNVGYWVGRTGGYRLLLRYGRYIRLDRRRLKLGQYLFAKHGGKVVFFGRFVAVLRTWAAFLAGVNRMDVERFLLFNATGGVLWAAIFGIGAYTLGIEMERLSKSFAWVLASLGAVGAVSAAIFVHRNEARLLAEADKAMPPD
jgi:membrane protein DedA with SNARE-associated domain